MQIYWNQFVAFYLSRYVKPFPIYRITQRRREKDEHLFSCFILRSQLHYYSGCWLNALTAQLSFALRIFCFDTRTYENESLFSFARHLPSYEERQIPANDEMITSKEQHSREKMIVFGDAKRKMHGNDSTLFTRCEQFRA